MDTMGGSLSVMVNNCSHSEVGDEGSPDDGCPAPVGLAHELAARRHAVAPLHLQWAPGEQAPSGGDGEGRQGHGDTKLAGSYTKLAGSTSISLIEEMRWRG